jgi:uncharacterized protein YbgA (DUF1722 family)/uncharacterized protein YbbK (DUF523 family)
VEAPAKPIVVASKCLEFAACRWNGLTIPCETIRRMMPHVEFLPVCPEAELGLGIPRDPIRVVVRGGRRLLLQPATGRDVTDDMQQFVTRHLDGLPDVDGFLLKSRSPSCGTKDVKLHRGPEKNAYVEGRGAGFFGAAVRERFPLHAVEDEGRLLNFRIRDHFLTRIFAFARFRAARATGRMSELVRFQAENKFLLLAHSQKHMRELGRAVANHGRLPFDELADRCERVLREALERPSRPSNDVNVLMHAQGFFSDRLTAGERRYFQDTLARYRAERLPRSAVTAVVRGNAVRFEAAWLLQQTFFQPYPEELADLGDSGKGRDL